MQRSDKIIEKLQQLFSAEEITRVIGWKKGEFCYDESPAVFGKDNLDGFVYDDFSSPNVSKYLINETLKEGKIAALLKPCDTYSFNQLLTEHRIKRENVLAVAIACDGKIDIEKITALGIKGITSVESDGTDVTVHTIYGDKKVAKEDVILERCKACKGSKHVAADIYIDCDPESEELKDADAVRFTQVEELEAMSADERFEFWRSQLSKCIRCNACRNVCPACSCRTCVFDNPDSEVSTKSNTTSFEENMFHIIRAFHVAGRCTDCGECSRVCPQHIPLHLLNRKFIKDMDLNYGKYQAGESEGQVAPLVSYTTEDVEPTVISDGGKA